MPKWAERISWTTLIMQCIGILLVVLIVVGSVRTLAGGRYTGTQWFDLFIDGLTLGSIYALIALGYTMVYGVLRMINFAHGEVFMGGAFTAFFLADAFNRSGFMADNPALALLLVTLLCVSISTIIAVLLERIAYRPLRGAPRLVPLITAIGASFFLQYTFRGFYGSNNKAYPIVDALEGEVALGAFGVGYTELLVIISAFIMMASLYYFIQRTKTGRAMRAVAEDREAAALMGVDVNRTIVITFALGGALAGVAGIMYSLIFYQVNAFIGFIPGVKAFTAAVLGGIGNIPGAMVGGLLLGVMEAVGPNLFLEGLDIPAANQLKDVIAFTMLVLILIFRPTGIIGERLAKKKA